MKDNLKIAIVGLGYVGLPLAVLFSEKFNVIGYDINKKRIDELRNGFDNTNEIESDVLLSSLESNLVVTNNLNDLELSNVFIITVPTPVDSNNNPDLTPLLKATKEVASIINKGSFVIYESTVYPGVTEEEMIPVIEEISGLILNETFYCGYSPERINPGDKKHTVKDIIKVTSGSNSYSSKFIDELYGSVIKAGTYKAPSIKVAEASKVIENTQRDINIAFVNELSKIFALMNIDTHEVLEAASTKWNFLRFTPGLVGGHCIGVDPYYLAQKAEALGYHPEIILSGRRINDSMGLFIAQRVVKLMIRNQIDISNSKILILGFTFKENCPDIRNTRVIDIYKELKSFGTSIDVYDPSTNPEEVFEKYGIKLTPSLGKKKYDSVILAVAHDHFNKLSITELVKENHVIYDVKSFLDKKIVSNRL